MRKTVFPPKMTNLKTVQYIWKPLTDWKVMPFSKTRPRNYCLAADLKIRWL